MLALFMQASRRDAASQRSRQRRDHSYHHENGKHASLVAFYAVVRRLSGMLPHHASKWDE